MQIGLIFLPVVYMSFRCLERQFHIDRIWDHFYYIIRDTPKTLELKYKAEMEKIEQNKDFDKKLIIICKYNFSKENPLEPFWWLTLLRIGNSII